MITTITLNSSEDYETKRKEEFVKTLTEIINNDILPTYGEKIKTLNIEMGLFTSDNYGSYRIPFFDGDKQEICYIIADTILGEWKVFKNNDYE